MPIASINGEPIASSFTLGEAVTGRHSYNELAYYYGAFGKYALDGEATTGTDVTDASAWDSNAQRLSSHTTPIVFDHACTLRIKSGVSVKVAKLTDGVMAEPLPSAWVTYPDVIALDANQQYLITLKRTAANTNVSQDDMLKIYVDSLEQYVDERATAIMEYGEHPMNLLQGLYGTFRNIVPKKTGESISDNSNWQTNSARLSSRILFVPPIDCKIRCDSGYRFKVGMVENDILVSWSSPWYVEYQLTANVQYVFGLAHAAGLPTAISISEEGALKIDVLDQTLEEMASSGNVAVKPYYEAEIADTIEKIRAANTEPSLVFFWCSDLHHMSVQGTRVKDDTVTDMTANMRAIASKVRIDGLICLGDVVDAKDPTTTDETRAEIDYVMERLHWVGVPIIYAMGNHDDNRYVESGTERFEMGECYSRMVSYSLPERVSDPVYGGLNYFVDYPQHKIRLMVADANFLDSDDDVWKYGYAEETRKWLQAQFGVPLQDYVVPEGYVIPSDYSAILLAHMSPIKEHNYGFNDYPYFDEIKADIQAWVNGGGKYIGTLYGHTHVDYSATSPWLEVAIGAQKCQNVTINAYYPSGSVAPTRTALTATEDLWDVLIIKPNSHEIECIRFGAGSDRSFTY